MFLVGRPRVFGCGRSQKYLNSESGALNFPHRWLRVRYSRFSSIVSKKSFQFTVLEIDMDKPGGEVSRSIMGLQRSCEFMHFGLHLLPISKWCFELIELFRWADRACSL